MSDRAKYKYNFQPIFYIKYKGSIVNKLKIGDTSYWRRYKLNLGLPGVQVDNNYRFGDRCFFDEYSVSGTETVTADDFTGTEYTKVNQIWYDSNYVTKTSAGLNNEYSWSINYTEALYNKEYIGPGRRTRTESYDRTIPAGSSGDTVSFSIPVIRGLTPVLITTSGSVAMPRKSNMLTYVNVSIVDVQSFGIVIAGTLKKDLASAKTTTINVYYIGFKARSSSSIVTISMQQSNITNQSYRNQLIYCEQLPGGTWGVWFRNKLPYGSLKYNFFSTYKYMAFDNSPSVPNVVLPRQPFEHYDNYVYHGDGYYKWEGVPTEAFLILKNCTSSGPNYPSESLKTACIVEAYLDETATGSYYDRYTFDNFCFNSTSGNLATGLMTGRDYVILQKSGSNIKIIDYDPPGTIIPLSYKTKTASSWTMKTPGSTFSTTNAQIKLDCMVEGSSMRPVGDTTEIDEDYFAQDTVIYNTQYLPGYVPGAIGHDPSEAATVTTDATYEYVVISTGIGAVNRRIVLTKTSTSNQCTWTREGKFRDGYPIVNGQAYSTSGNTVTLNATFYVEWFPGCISKFVRSKCISSTTGNKTVIYAPEQSLKYLPVEIIYNPDNEEEPYLSNKTIFRLIKRGIDYKDCDIALISKRHSKGNRRRIDDCEPTCGWPKSSTGNVVKTGWSGFCWWGVWFYNSASNHTFYSFDLDESNYDYTQGIPFTGVLNIFDRYKPCKKETDLSGVAWFFMLKKRKFYNTPLSGSQHYSRDDADATTSLLSNFVGKEYDSKTIYYYSDSLGAYANTKFTYESFRDL